ncbi:MAG TPA: hypothetical protein VFK05_19200 [Polyangiaceae bacterium]|nr:hypothetical protein [Polyangiaceae bacterium]
MIKVNPNGGPTVLAGLPISGTRDDRRAAMRDALKGLMPAPPPAEPATPEPGSEGEFDALLAELEQMKGADAVAAIVNTEDCAAARADPITRAGFIETLKAHLAHHAKKKALAALEASKADAAATDRERERLRGLARKLAAAEDKASA